jgi:hypothetical protein
MMMRSMIVSPRWIDTNPIRSLFQAGFVTTKNGFVPFTNDPVFVIREPAEAGAGSHAQPARKYLS